MKRSDQADRTLGSNRLTTILSRCSRAGDILSTTELEGLSGLGRR